MSGVSLALTIIAILLLLVQGVMIGYRLARGFPIWVSLIGVGACFVTITVGLVRLVQL